MFVTCPLTAAQEFIGLHAPCWQVGRNIRFSLQRKSKQAMAIVLGKSAKSRPLMSRKKP